MASNSRPPDSFDARNLLHRGIYDIQDIFPHSDKAISHKDAHFGIIDKNSDSFDSMCRICHAGNSLEDLLRPCKCKGSIALAHLKCLETWLIESNRNECELCQYHFRIVREPRYGTIWSIFVFLRHPGRHLRELIVDVCTLIIYTPLTLTSTYMLLVLCESLAKNSVEAARESVTSHLVSVIAIFGTVTINSIYTTWLTLSMEKYMGYWRDFYKKNGTLKVILSNSRLAVRQID